MEKRHVNEQSLSTSNIQAHTTTVSVQSYTLSNVTFQECGFRDMGGLSYLTKALNFSI